MLYCRYLLMLCVILIFACGIGADGPIIGEWQAVKDLRAANKLLEQVKKERDLYLSILQQPKWMNALGDSIG